MVKSNGSDSRDLLLQLVDQVGSFGNRLDRVEQGLAETRAICARTVDLLNALATQVGHLDKRADETNETLSKLTTTVAAQTEVLSMRVTDHERRIRKLEAGK